MQQYPSSSLQIIQEIIEKKLINSINNSTGISDKGHTTINS
jgi:hypothetical protein